MEYLGESKPVNSVLPLVSICVPTFQHAPFIATCLDSILMQETDFRYEILIGEDDSKDGTREICIRYAEEYPDKIRLFLRKEEDKIFMFGRKAGRLNHLGLYGSARGEFVCICDGDDYWIDPLKLQKQVKVIQDFPKSSFCITNTKIEDSEVDFPPGIPQKFTTFLPKQLKKVQYLGHISSWMMRNHMSDLLKNRIVTKPIPLDMVVFTFYKLRGLTVYLPDVTTTYRMNPTGVYRSQSSKKNHKMHYRNNWYLFYYLHQDPIHFLRTIAYSLKRGFHIFVKPKTAPKLNTRNLNEKANHPWSY